MSGRVAFGYVLPMQMERDGEKPAWAKINALVKRAAELGFDTVWTVDEIVWRRPSWPGPRGFWECLTWTGAVAASSAITGSIEQIAETLASFADIDVTRVEIMPSAGTLEELEQLGAVLAMLR